MFKLPPAATAADPFQRHPHASESFGLAILWGLQRKPVWQGDATPQRTARRRARNRVARASRRANRGSR